MFTAAKRRLLRIGLLIAVVWIGGEYAASYFGWPPAYHWYSVQADFDVDGTPVSVGGVVECKRKGLGILAQWFTSGPTGVYRSGVHTFAERLQDGSVLMMKPQTPCGSPDVPISRQFPDGFYPLVYWLDDAESPTHIELFFSLDYYARPDARVRFKGFTAERLGAAPSFLFRPWAHKSQAKLPGTVPWLSHREPPGFRGYVATVVDEDLWRNIPGLDVTVERIATLTLFDKWVDLTPDKDTSRRLRALLCHGFERCSVGARSTRLHGCRDAGPEPPELCSGIRRTVGIATDQGTLGAAYVDRGLSIGMTTLVPNHSAPNINWNMNRIEVNGDELRGRLKYTGFGWLLYSPANRQFLLLRAVNASARVFTGTPAKQQ